MIDWQPMAPSARIARFWNSGRTSTCHGRYRQLLELTIRTLKDKVPGGFVEYGCWYGAASCLMVMTSHDCEGSFRTAEAYDTFTGLVPPGEGDSGTELKEGDFNAPFEIAKAMLEEWGMTEHVELIPGDVLETVGRRDTPVSVAYVDVNLYEPTVHCINDAAKRLSPGGVMVLDDYRRDNCPGVARAVMDTIGVENVNIGPGWTGWWRKKG